MPAPTAVAICGLGWGIIAFAWRQHQAQRHAAPPWSPVLAALTASTTSVALWQALRLLHPSSTVGQAVLVVGLLQAALLYLVVHFLTSARVRTSELRKLNSTLQ